MKRFSDELTQLLREHIPTDEPIYTVANGKPNLVVEIEADGVRIETERSKERGADPEVPAWMIQSAWDYFQLHGRLANKVLQASDGLSVNRSSAVCAILARMPGVDVESRRPLMLRRG